MVAGPVQVRRKDKCRIRPHGSKREIVTGLPEGEREAVIGGLGEAGKSSIEAENKGLSGVAANRHRGMLLACTG